MPSEALINLENISIFQKKILILSDVQLKISKGEFVYLIGKTGSGKSSLMKLLYCDIPVNEGIAHVAGYDLTSIKKKEIPYLRRKIGIVFQDFQLLIDRSLSENLLFIMRATGWKDKKAMNERLEYVLNKVGLNTKGFKFPHQLSGGEQQRVVIARALINSPEIILADEPTGNLDPTTSEGILDLLIDISKTGVAVLMGTHDYTLLKKYPARTLKCEGGKLIENYESIN